MTFEYTPINYEGPVGSACVWCGCGVTKLDRYCVKCGGPNIFFIDTTPQPAWLERKKETPGDTAEWWTTIEGWREAHIKELMDGSIPSETCPKCGKLKPTGRWCPCTNPRN